MKDGIKIIHVELDEELHRKFKAIASEGGYTLKGMVTQLIKQEVNRYDNARKG